MKDALVKAAFEQRLKELFDGETSHRGTEGGIGYAVGTTRGPVRSENQDRAFVAHIVQGGEKPRELLVAAIFDGMGGMREGGAAASSAAASFLAALATVEGPVAFRLEAATVAANSVVHNEMHGRGGTTLTAVAFPDPRIAHVVHVGDSRLYRSQDRSELTLVTEDQTLTGLVQGEARIENEDELDNRLLQFVGIGSELQPSFHKIVDDSYSTWLLTTDGAHAFGRRNLLGLLRTESSCLSITRRMITAADAFGTDDNATMIALRPSEFRSHPPAFEGTTLSVWTPFSTLELWLEGRSAPFISPAASVDEPTNDRSRSLPQKRAPKTKPSKRSRKKTTAPTEKQAKLPQLNITFGDAGGTGDDN